jgi:GNAT superfamily N-acetyltransferase
LEAFFKHRELIMGTIDWDKAALFSEIEYSKALKSEPVEYQSFIHLCNPFVPWSGDFNRAVGVKITDYQSFEDVTSHVECIHSKKNLDRPRRFDIYPPVLQENLWGDYLLKKGYSLSTAIFFSASTIVNTVPPEFKLETPSQDEYIEWFYHLSQSRGYFEEEWFQKLKPLQLNFSSIFKPYWLMKRSDLVGWVYCANLGNYARLFEVEVVEAFRGQGFGKLLLQSIRAEGSKMGVKFILLQSGEGLRRFYEGAGFQERTKNSIIWSKE